MASAQIQWLGSRVSYVPSSNYVTVSVPMSYTVEYKCGVKKKINTSNWKHGSASVQDASSPFGHCWPCGRPSGVQEGKVAFFVKKLQNIYKHHLFHCENRVRYKVQQHT